MTQSQFAATLCALLSLAAAPAGAGNGDDPSLPVDAAPWSGWQGRVSLGSTFPARRAGLAGFRSDGPSVNRSTGVDTLSLMGDYYFARPFATSAGGFRATSGLIVGPRSQLSVVQPDLATGNAFGAGNRLFGPSAGPFRGGVAGGDAPGETAAALPYVGLGYTGRAAGGALSFSADLGIIGQPFGEAATRPFGTAQRSFEDTGRDNRRTPLLQLGVLYSF